MRQRIAAAIGLLYVQGALAQVPQYQPLDLPARYDPPPSVSKKPVVIEAYTAKGENMPGLPGIYQPALAPVPAVEVYANADARPSRKMSGTLWATLSVGSLGILAATGWWAVRRAARPRAAVTIISS